MNREAAKNILLSSGKIYEQEYFTGEEILTPYQSRVIEQLSLLIPLQQKLQKNKRRTKKRFGALKQIESIFPKKQLNDLIIDKLKEIMKLQNNIKLGNLKYTTKSRKSYNFSRYSLPIVFIKDINKGNSERMNSVSQEIQTKFQRLNQHLNQNLNQQYLLHLEIFI